MDEQQEILQQLRQVRFQIAFTPIGEERTRLIELGEKLHKDYAKSLAKGKKLERKKGR